MATDEGTAPGRRAPDRPDGADADASPVWVFRGETSGGATPALLDRAGETGRSAVRAWIPDRRVMFGRRDAHDRGYDRARRAARRRGYRAVERRVGGRAVAYTGRTVAFARATPLADPRRGLDDRYAAAVGAVRDALAALGADLVPGEPPDSFCPGAHSLRARDGGKVVGLAQRIRADAALVGGCVLVDDHEAQRAVLAPVYGALDHPLDPAAVGSLATAGGPAAPDRVARAIEAALVGGRPIRVTDGERVPERTS